jgi:hypothetical protein
MLIILNILINLAIIFLMYHYLKWSLGKNRGSSELENFEEETEKLIIEINRTTERNLQLLESKISQIKSVIDDADRVVSVINREKSGNRQEAAVLKKLENRSFFENVEKVRTETEEEIPVITFNRSVQPENTIKRTASSDYSPPPAQLLHRIKNPGKVVTAGKEQLQCTEMELI